MGSDRRRFFNQLVNVGALSGLAAILPSDALAKAESTLLGETSESSEGSKLQTNSNTTQTHIFHANAHILRSDSGHPLVSQLGNKAAIRLPDEGGFRSQFVDGYQSGD